MKKTNNNSGFAFTKSNYILLIIGVLLIIIGLFVMKGGSMEDMSNMSYARTTISPILIILGFVVNVFAILYQKKGE